MNIEEKAIEVLKHCKDRNFSAFDKIYFDDGTNMCIYQAIETLLTVYEKEKEKNKKIDEYVRQCDWHDNDVYIGEDILDILEEE